MTDREQLQNLVKRGEQFRSTPIVDDDFQAYRNQFDLALALATTHLAGKPVSAVKSVLQDWVMGLGLRHQGVLLTAVRGCDTAPKNDPSKLLARSFRVVVLNAFVGDPRKAQTFMEVVSREALFDRFMAFKKNCDHYPHHYVMHLMHAAEVVGYKHPDDQVAADWRAFYLLLCSGLHINPETEPQLDERLTADETTFGQRDRAVLTPMRRA